MKLLIILVSVFVALTKAQSRTFPHFQSRIVGGKEAYPRQFPHQVALMTDTNNLCSGSIIEENVILTSASCLRSIDKKVTVTAGVHDRTKQEPTQQIRESGSFKMHGEFDTNYLFNNVGLIYLSDPLQLNEYVTKIPLYRGTSSLFDQQATASGWGKFSDISEGYSNVLRYVTNNIISNDQCKMFHFVLAIRDSNVCLSGFEGKGGCTGDSGAPLHISENNILYLAGIGSFGNNGPCAAGFPSVFSRISSFATWIDDNKNIKP